MKTLAILVLGVCFGFALAQFIPRTVAAVDIKITGESGTLDGYDVMRNGESICSEPYLSTNLQIIECD